MSSIELISADGDGGVSNSSDESPDSIKARDATKRLALLFHEKQTELARAAEKVKHLEAALEASEDRIAAATSSQSGPRGGPASLASRKVIELSKENARLQATLRNSKANAVSVFLHSIMARNGSNHAPTTFPGDFPPRPRAWGFFSCLTGSVCFCRQVRIGFSSPANCVGKTQTYAAN